MKKLSIVVPVYFNEESLLPLYTDLKENVLDILPKYDFDYELIFVDDGSKDNSYSVMQELAKLDKKIVLYKHSRNFGEHAAILAGLSRATGDCMVRKAADLQEPSKLIIDMLEKYIEGNKVIIATRAERDDSWLARKLGHLYASMVRKFALPNYPKNGFDSFLIDKQVAQVLVDMKEKNTSLMSQIVWCGFKTTEVPYTRLKREKGKSRWTFSKKVKLTIDSLLSFSYFPVRFITFLGIMFAIASFITVVVIIIGKIVGFIDVEGYASIIAIMLFGFGIIMFSLGILGEYMWRIFDAARNRPPFIIDEQDK